MITLQESDLIGIYLEGFFYGLYSGIFVIYLQSMSNRPRAAVILYALCLLYVLSAATVVCDVLGFIFQARMISASLQLQIDLEPVIFRLFTIQTVVSGCCDFLAQCIIIYRCWIVWGQNIQVVTIPSFLAIAYIVTWMVPIAGTTTFVQGILMTTTWGGPVSTTSFAASMAVNALVTGLIVYKILRVFLEVKAASTSVERSFGSTGGTKFRHIIFVIIESGMLMFAVQLVRVVLFSLPLAPAPLQATNVVTGISEMFNGITPTIILVRVSMKLSFDDKESFNETVGSLRFINPPSNSNTLQDMGSSGSILPQDSERNEDICFNNPTSDPDTLRRMGSSSIVSPQERSEDT